MLARSEANGTGSSGHCTLGTYCCQDTVERHEPSCCSAVDAWKCLSNSQRKAQWFCSEYGYQEGKSCVAKYGNKNPTSTYINNFRPSLHSCEVFALHCQTTVCSVGGWLRLVWNPQKKYPKEKEREREFWVLTVLRYVGAMPGKLVQCLKVTQSLRPRKWHWNALHWTCANHRCSFSFTAGSNPVILIDEIDKSATECYNIFSWERQSEMLRKQLLNKWMMWIDDDWWLMWMDDIYTHHIYIHIHICPL